MTFRAQVQHSTYPRRRRHASVIVNIPSGKVYRLVTLHLLHWAAFKREETEFKLTEHLLASLVPKVCRYHPPLRGGVRSSALPGGQLGTQKLSG